MFHQELQEISWTAPEFIHYPKSSWWFLGLALIAVVFVGFFIWQKDFLTAVLFGLLFLILFYFGKMPARTIQIRLTGSGIKLNNLKLSYQQIKNFWIVYEPPAVKILNFETTAYLNRYLTLQLENEDPIQIRQFLLRYLPEDLEKGEQFSDKLTRTLKF